MSYFPHNNPTGSPKSSISTRILVCGASGNVGRHLAEALLCVAKKQNFQIRVAVRDLKKACDLVKKGAEAVQVDFADPKSIRAALDSVDRVFVAPPNPGKFSLPFERIRLALNVLQAVKCSDSVKFVLLGSVPDANEDGPQLFLRELFHAENYLRQIGVSYAIVRMAVFVENLLAARDALSCGELPLPLGSSGAYPPAALNDIGAAAAAILVNPYVHHGATYTITGPELLTGRDAAKALAHVLQHPVRYVDASKDTMCELFEPFMPHWQVSGLLELFEIFQAKGLPVSHDFEKLTGRAATPFEQRVKQLKHAGLL